MANRCFKIPPSSSPERVLEPSSHLQSLCEFDSRSERVIKRSKEASASSDAQESLSQVKQQVEWSTRLPETGHGDELLEMAVEFHASFPILIEVRTGLDSNPCLCSVCAFGDEGGVKRAERGHPILCFCEPVSLSHGGSAESTVRLPQETILSGPRAQWFLFQLSNK